MFTGLIQSLGKLKSLGNDYFQISCTSNNSYQILQDLAIGDSVAVDGVCLTVVEVLFSFKWLQVVLCHNLESLVRSQIQVAEELVLLDQLHGK